MKRKKIDPNQMQFDFDFSERVESYIAAREQIEEAIERGPNVSNFENEFEIMMEIAVAAKLAIRDSGFSREQIVDGINAYLGRTEEGAKADPPICRKPLTIHMLNNYLSKPTEYPLQAFMLVAIHYITGSLAPAETMVAYEGAQVVTGEEIKLLTLGKLEQSLAEMNKLRRELKK